MRWLTAALTVLAFGCMEARAGAVVFWTDQQTGTIGRANPDGSGVTESLITGAAAPAGMAADGQYLYWANASTSSIARANLDGTGVDLSFITGANSPVGVAVDGQHLYWANQGSSAIGRANLDGTGVDQAFIAGTNNSYGVAVDASLTTSSSGPTRPVTRCVVPRLAHMRIGTATLALRRAHCRLGRVHRPHHIPRHHRLRVIKQSARPRTTHAPHFPIYIIVT